MQNNTKKVLRYGCVGLCTSVIITVIYFAVPTCDKIDLVSGGANLCVSGFEGFIQNVAQLFRQAYLFLGLSGVLGAIIGCLVGALYGKLKK